MLGIAKALVKTCSMLQLGKCAAMTVLMLVCKVEL